MAWPNFFLTQIKNIKSLKHIPVIKILFSTCNNDYTYNQSLILNIIR